MLGNLIKKNRKSYFPECEDFTSDMDHIRYEENVNKLSHNAWFWCHPSNFKIMYYGTPATSMTMFLIMAFFTKDWIGIIALINLVFGGIMAYDLIRKLMRWKQYKYTTMYDMYMRDYVVDEE